MIRWREWGPDVFREAREREKPVLLSIGATWCHWCHVMDGEAYATPEVARLVESEFIPVRVDTDRQPEVNRRYNMGGWPTTAFLNSEGAVLTGFTYMPAGEFLGTLHEVSRLYRESPGIRGITVEETGAGRYMDVQPARGRIGFHLVEEFRGLIERGFDRNHGGFGMAPKFPHAEALDFALEMHTRTGSRDLLDIVTSTLDGMAGGGMYDHVMGGFFRYSTTRDWSVPHFEKMLEDNARLILTYSSAFRVTGRQRYRELCLETATYLDSTLQADSGGYYGSQDADEEYYGLGLEERRAKPAPRIDRTVYVNWNALAASAFIRASRLLDQPQFAGRARDILDLLLSQGYTAGEGMSHFIGEDGARGGSLFEDQIEMCAALLDAYASGARGASARGSAPRAQEGYRAAAEDLISVCLRDYWDEESGGFFDIPARLRKGGRSAGAVGVPVKTLEHNSKAAEALRRMEAMGMTPEPGRLEANAVRCLEAFAGSFQEYGLTAAPFAIALLHHQRPVRVEVSGVADSPGTRDILERLDRSFLPGADLLVVGDGRDGPEVRVCAGKTCLPPAYMAADILRRVEEASRLSP